MTEAMFCVTFKTVSRQLILLLVLLSDFITVIFWPGRFVTVLTSLQLSYAICVRAWRFVKDTSGPVSNGHDDNMRFTWAYVENVLFVDETSFRLRKADVHVRAYRLQDKYNTAGGTNRLDGFLEIELINRTRQSSDIMTQVGTSLTVEHTPEFSKTLENQIMNESDTVTLECQLSKPNQAVHWTKNGEAIVQEDRIIVTSDAYKHQLIIRDVTLEDAGKFSCVYDNTRTECTLTVKELALQLTKELEDLAVTETLDVTLECQLNKPYKKVQWEINANQVRPDDRIYVIADTFIHKLLIRNVTPEDSGIYRCVCDSIRTCCSLTVKEFETTFTKKLKNQIVNETETLTLECQLSKPNKTAEWTKNNLPVVQDDRIAVIVDVHKHQLNISGVMLEDAGEYACVYGNVKTECTLNVEELAAAFTRTLKSQTVNETATVNLECRLSKPNKTVQWVKDGEQIRPDDRITVTVAIYTHRLVIQDVKMADAGNFQCVCGNVGTHCTLTIIESTEQTDCFDLRKYINWIKTSVSLCFLKEGITAFSNGMSANFHKAVRERVSLKQPNAATKQCQNCTRMQIGKDKNETWRMNCSMNICSVWLEEILPYHRHESPKIEWKNSDPKLWPSDCWEIVKIFQPYGCEHQHRAEDSDATGLLTLILDCQFFSKFMSNPQHLQEIKDVRNVCMHSKDLIMNDTEMKQSLNLMVTFLGEKELQKYQSAIDAAKKIKQLRDGQLDVALDVEESVIKEKLAEVKQNITRLENTNKNLCGATWCMSVKQDTYKKEYRKRLEEFKESFSKAKNTIGTFIKKKNPTITKQFITLINRLQELEQDNREVDEYYQAKLSTNGSEEENVNLEAQELKEKPATRQSVTTESTTPWFTKDLQSQTVDEKATVTLECQLSKPNQTVTWLKGVTQVYSNERITMETDHCTHRLIIREVTLEDAGKFWCFCDDDNSCCALQVKELPPQFITRLENHTAIESGTVPLECQLSKPDQPVQWMKNEQPIPADDRITVTTDTYIHRLVMTNVTLEDAGIFRCICGKDSTQCTVTVNELASDIINGLENQTEKERGTVTLTCVLSRPNKKVMWMKGDKQVISDYHITITVDKYTHQLIIRDLTLDDAGKFRCICGNVSTECTLTVEERPLEFTKKLEDQKTVMESIDVTLECQLSKPNSTVTWKRSGKEIFPDKRISVDSKEDIHKLIIKNVTLEDAGTYYCYCDNVSTHCTLEVAGDADKREEREKMKKVADLRTTLLDLYKDRLQCIPIYLIKPNCKHPVKDLYVKQNLKRVDPRGKPEHPDNPHIHQTGNQDKNIDKVTDILFKDGKVCKDVYVTSEAGYGKTMFCAHLVRLWCDAHSKTDADSASIDPDLANDLQSMKMFSLLFYINLSGADIPKDIKEQYEIPTLICTQLQFSEDEYIDDIKRCLEDTSTLVLMDSLDEMIATKLPARGLHNKSCIVRTSRPWKLEALRSQLQSPADYQQVEIVGLAETSPTDLVKNVLKILNKELEPDQEKKGVDFFRAVKDANLQDFLAIPVLILQILMLWYDGEQFGSSQSEIYLNVVHHQILTAIKNKKLQKYYGKSERPFPLPCSCGSQCGKAYGELLWKVANMAFHTLFGESMCLVFDHDITSFYGLSDEEVKICLKMGILTQHKLFVKKISAEKKSVSFLHKTNQENFSAVFLSCKWSEYVKNQIFSFIKDLDRAMELDKVLLFCSQLNQDVARELSRLISVRADDDKRVQEYRQSGEYNAAPNRDLIYKIQNIVSAAVQQSIKISPAPSNALISSTQQAAEAPTPITQTRSGSTPKLIMADIILEEPQWRRTIVIDDRRLVEALDMAELKSVRINAEYADVTIWKLLEQETRSLQSLVVYGQKTNVENIHGVVVRNLATLRTLGLHGGGEWRPPLDLSGLGNKVSVMLTCDLTCLLLHKVELSHKQCVMLVQRLSEKQNLQQLTLSYMTFSHKQCVMLVQRLCEKQNLQQLTLEFITCQTHGYKGGECCDVKLQSRLEHVKLRWLPFRDVSFHTVDLKTCEIWLHPNVPAATSALSCLTSASDLSNLREFTCYSLRGVASVQKLVTVLPRLHGLQRIVLGNIDFGSEREIRLSAAAKTLESVELRVSTITADGLESLVESVKAPRVKITLYGVTIRDRDPRDFLQRLRESPDYEVTEDRGVEYQEWRGRWLVERFVFYKNK